MLKVRVSQIGVFKDLAVQLFEDEMMVHSRSFSPQTCEVLSDDELRMKLRSAMLQSGTYGFSDRGPVRTYIELMLLFGSGFDTDPQYSSLRDILKGSGHQMSRAELLYEYILDYQSDKSG